MSMLEVPAAGSGLRRWRRKAVVCLVAVLAVAGALCVAGETAVAYNPGHNAVWVPTSSVIITLDAPWGDSLGVAYPHKIATDSANITWHNLTPYNQTFFFHRGFGDVRQSFSDSTIFHTIAPYSNLTLTLPRPGDYFYSEVNDDLYGHVRYEPAVAVPAQPPPPPPPPTPAAPTGVLYSDVSDYPIATNKAWLITAGDNNQTVLYPANVLVDSPTIAIAAPAGGPSYTIEITNITQAVLAQAGRHTVVGLPGPGEYAWTINGSLANGTISYFR